ncbi:hypothetical protein ACQP1P_21555 [Dactylosporangium sp. CA-052675]|uniref:hypothetical protein n=1 Tax=Dactylosporangium sp. CA-052675 TaxID=3239927 RepID=UPI003D8EDED0
MNRIAFGTAIGMALGFAVAFGSFGQMLIVAVFTALGYGVAKVVAGDVVDLRSYRITRSGK